MTNQQIKQLIKDRFGSMARLGRKLTPQVNGQTISLVVDGKRTSKPLQGKIARALKVKKAELWPNLIASGEQDAAQSNAKSKAVNG